MVESVWHHLNTANARIPEVPRRHRIDVQFVSQDVSCMRIKHRREFVGVDHIHGHRVRSRRVADEAWS